MDQAQAVCRRVGGCAGPWPGVPCAVPGLRGGVPGCPGLLEGEDGAAGMRLPDGDSRDERRAGDAVLGEEERGAVEAGNVLRDKEQE